MNPNWLESVPQLVSYLERLLISSGQNLNELLKSVELQETGRYEKPHFTMICSPFGRNCA